MRGKWIKFAQTAITEKEWKDNNTLSVDVNDALECQSKLGNYAFEPLKEVPKALKDVKELVIELVPLPNGKQTYRANSDNYQFGVFGVKGINLPDRLEIPTDKVVWGLCRQDGVYIENRAREGCKRSVRIYANIEKALAATEDEAK